MTETAGSLSADPLIVATYFTLAGDVHPFAASTVSPVPFALRAEAAGRAGYRGIGLGAQDVLHLMKTLGPREIRIIAEANGLELIELEVLVDWYASGDRRAESDKLRAALLDAAADIGAVHLKVGGDLANGDWPIEGVIEDFAGLCDDAARAGTGICIEVFPGSSIANLDVGTAIVAGAGRPNGGLLLDIWHMVRGGIDFADIARMDPAHILHVEIDDADAVQQGSIVDDTIDRRRLCGEGELPLPAFLRAIAETGYNGAWGVEILSVEQRARTPEEAARRSFETARRYFPGR
ncbi:sugar phosphate isomerase/epimerase family protein [Rhizorhabdus sp.]|uniref:sugar phosphate isomerase/epimerase family protein n=1 Tax=Rhizorhabdus sp. TaxID=1968843 RepID=UPI0035B2EE52